MDHKKEISLILGLALGSIIIAGLLLNVVGLVNPFLFAILSVLLITIFYKIFINFDNVKEKNQTILIAFTGFVSLVMIIFSRFPSSDFWWYHAKNWFIVNYLLDVGKIIGWVPGWHFGYPLLQLYGPGSHVISIFFATVFGLPIFYSEIIVNSLTYILLILALDFFLSKHMSSKTAMLISLVAAVSPRLFNEIFIQGHYPNMLALAFGLIGLSFLDSKEKKERVLFHVFMFLALITHFSFFTILLAATAIALTLLRRFKHYKLLVKFLAPIMFAAFWLLPAMVESRYWHGNLTGTPNPAVIYLLSFGPFILLAAYGMYAMYKERMNYLLAFITSLIIMSFLPVILFPVLPDGLNNLLQKLFVDTFKSTATASIFIVIPIVIAVKQIITMNKKVGIFLIVLLLSFFLFSDYIYAKQDAVDVISFNGQHYRDNSLTRVYINNYQSIKDVLTEDNAIYNIDPIIGPSLFNVFAASGPPIPAPIRRLEQNEEKHLDFLKEKNVRINIFDKKVDLEDYRVINAIGFYTKIEYDLSPGYIYQVAKDGEIIDYIINPEDYPSKTEDKEVKIYWQREPGKFIDDGLNDTSINVNLFGENLQIDNKLEYKIIQKGLEIKIRNKDSHKLKIGFNYSPHWKAYADGKRMKIFKAADDTLILDVPAGSEKVEIIWGYGVADYIGMLVSIAALTALIAFAIKKD